MLPFDVGTIRLIMEGVTWFVAAKTHSYRGALIEIRKSEGVLVFNGKVYHFTPFPQYVNIIISKTPQPGLIYICRMSLFVESRREVAWLLKTFRNLPCHRVPLFFSLNWTSPEVLVGIGYGILLTGLFAIFYCNISLAFDHRYRSELNFLLGW